MYHFCEGCPELVCFWFPSYVFGGGITWGIFVITLFGDWIIFGSKLVPSLGMIFLASACGFFGTCTGTTKLACLIGTSPTDNGSVSVAGISYWVPLQSLAAWPGFPQYRAPSLDTAAHMCFPFAQPFPFALHAPAWKSGQNVMPFPEDATVLPNF